MHDASREQKTAENLLELLEQTIEDVEENWGVVVVSVVTDASGKARKA